MRRIPFIAIALFMSFASANAQNTLVTRPIATTAALFDGALQFSLLLQLQVIGPVYLTLSGDFYVRDHHPTGIIAQGFAGPTLCVPIDRNLWSTRAPATLYLGVWPGLRYVFSFNNGRYPDYVLPVETGINFCFGFLTVGVYCRVDVLHLDTIPPCVVGLSVGL